MLGVIPPKYAPAFTSSFLMTLAIVLVCLLITASPTRTISLYLAYNSLSILSDTVVLSSSFDAVVDL